MVLYLCTDEPDIIEQRVPGTVRQDKREPGADGDVRVLKAGWRLGAALRAAKARYEAGLADPTGRTVSPHLRRPHTGTAIGSAPVPTPKPVNSCCVTYLRSKLAVSCQT